MPDPLITAAITSKVTPPPAPKPLKKLTNEELTKFGNWIPQGDTKIYASDLGKRGLLNTTQMFTEPPDVSTTKGIVNAQSDWKPAVIQEILMRARAVGITNPTEFLSNKEYLTNVSNKNYKDALNNPEFQKIHPNWWQVVSDLYKEQLKKEKG